MGKPSNTADYFKLNTTQERLEGLQPEERLEGLSPESIFQQFSPEVIEEYLSKLKDK